MLPTIATGNVGSALAGEYEVANSLRLDDGGSEYLTRTVSSAGSNTKSTLSAWVKRGNLSSGLPGGNHTLFGWTTDGNNFYNIKFGNSSDVLNIRWRNNTTQANYDSTEVFRDVSAWYHVVVAFDTTQSTASDRIKYYINGVQGPGLSGYPPQNETVLINNSSCVVRIADSGFSNGYFDGYVAEVVHVDGQQLDATSFGEFDEDTGIWKPIDVSGLTFGTNGFYLDFENSGSLGADVSGNGNNFTVNNLTSIDQVSDSPTNNYVTLNPLYTARFSSGSFTYSDGNTSLDTGANANYGYAVSSLAVNKGKWYWECKNTTVTRALMGVCYLNVLQGLSNAFYDETTYSAVGLFYTGSIYGRNDGVGIDSWSSGITPANNDIYGFALDMDNYKLYIHQNGTYLNSGDPVAGTGDVISQLDNYNYLNSGDYVAPFVGDESGTGTASYSMNFGNPAFSISSGNSDGNSYGNFEYAVPSGYYALNTKNLAEYG